MLSGTSLTLKQIAHALGFESPFHFSKAFKQRTGAAQPVAQWRAKGKKEKGEKGDSHQIYGE